MAAWHSKHCVYSLALRAPSKKKGGCQVNGKNKESKNHKHISLYIE